MTWPTCASVCSSPHALLCFPAFASPRVPRRTKWGIGQRSLPDLAESLLMNILCRLRIHNLQSCIQVALFHVSSAVHTLKERGSAFVLVWFFSYLSSYCIDSTFCGSCKWLISIGVPCVCHVKWEGASNILCTQCQWHHKWSWNKMCQNVWKILLLVSSCFFNFLVSVRYFQQVLLSGKLSTDGNEIQLHQDGSWSSLIVKKEQTRVLSPVVSVFCRRHGIL